MKTNDDIFYIALIGVAFISGFLIGFYFQNEILKKQLVDLHIGQYSVNPTNGNTFFEVYQTNGQWKIVK